MQNILENECMYIKESKNKSLKYLSEIQDL